MCAENKELAADLDARPPAGIEVFELREEVAELRKHVALLNAANESLDEANKALAEELDCVRVKYIANSNEYRKFAEGAKADRERQEAEVLRLRAALMGIGRAAEHACESEH